MKICQITSLHKQDDSRIFWKQCVSLAKAGHDVTLLVMDGESGVMHGVNVLGINGGFNRRVQRIRKAPGILLHSALQVNADVYHLHDPELLTIARKLKRKSGRAVVFDSHEDVPKQIMDKHWIPKLFRPIISFLVKKYEKFVTSRIDGVISVTPIICDRFRTYNPHVEMVANYPDLNEFKRVDAVATKKQNQICYIGGLFPTRGIRELVLALEHCDAKLVVAGKFSSDDFEQEISSLPNWNEVDYLGHVDRDQITKLLSESNVGIVTLHPTRSYMEAFPIKLFEYMSAGIPVVASDFPLWRTLVIDNGCGIVVDPMNVEAIATGIQNLLDHPKDAEGMGKLGKQAVEEKYSWESQAENLINFYKRIVG